nr:MAG TPA: hypothetical protein [Caudoviricetes sp.]
MKVYKENLELVKKPTTYYLFNSLMDASKFCDEKGAVGKLNPYMSSWVIASENDKYWYLSSDLFLSFLIDGIVEEVEE